MKKIYKSPRILVVRLASTRAFLQSSYTINNTESSTDAWTREYDNSSISNKNVWDDEW